MAGHALPQPDSRNGFQIAVICALQIESDAIEAVFDETYDSTLYGTSQGDDNSYTTGRIGRHHVVLAYLPNMGKAASAAAASSLKTSFPQIQLGLLVGVCGAVPNAGEGNARAILLGDVIISEGVIKFDFGRKFPNKLARKKHPADELGRASNKIRSWIKRLKGLSMHKNLKEETSHFLQEIISQDRFQAFRFPGSSKDILFPSDYRHKHHKLGACAVCDRAEGDDLEVCDIALNSTCDSLGCDKNRAIRRGRLAQVVEDEDRYKPELHFGWFGSGDLVMKSAKDRDRIAQEEKIIAFEMEAAGVWDVFDVIIIKSACDYADSHKNKEWQKFAALTAAACTKALLRNWIPAEQVQTISSSDLQALSNVEGLVNENKCVLAIQSSELGNIRQNVAVYVSHLFMLHLKFPVM